MKPSHEYIKIERMDFNQFLKSEYRKAEMVEVLEHAQEMMIRYYTYSLENFVFYATVVSDDHKSIYKRNFRDILKMANDMSDYKIHQFLEKYWSRKEEVLFKYNRNYNPHYLSWLAAAFGLCYNIVDGKIDFEADEKMQKIEENLFTTEQKKK